MVPNTSEVRGILRTTEPSELVETLVSRPVVFFAGSGISRPYPSCLPMANEIVKLTLGVVAPSSVGHEEQEQLFTCMLPELLFETIANCLPDTVHEAERSKRVDELRNTSLSPWSVLDIHPLEPNSSHYLLVLLANKWRLPILTTNYDRLLEIAAARLGFSALVCYEGGTLDPVWQSADYSDAVAIWKLHGHIEDLQVSATVRATSRKRKELLNELRKLFENQTACLIGYSGRDLDLFPEIAQFSFPGDEGSFWVQRQEPAQQHGIHLAYKKFKLVQLDSQELAARYVCRADEVSANTVPRLLRESVEGAQRLSSGDPEQLRDQAVHERLSKGKGCFRKLEELCTGESTRLLLWANLHQAMGQYLKCHFHALRFSAVTSDEVLPRLRWRGFMLLAGACHGLSLYKQQELACEKAREIARRHGLTCLEAVSLAFLLSALIVQNLPVLGHSDVRQALKRSSAWIAAARIYFGLHALSRLVAPVPSSTRTPPDPDLIDAWAAYLDRYLTVLGRMSQLPLLGLLVSKKLSRLRKHAEEFSEVLGLPGLKATALQYTRALELQFLTTAVGHELSKPTEQIIAELLGDRLRLAQINLERGNSILAGHHTEKAFECFDLARELSESLGNPYTELKSWVGIWKCGREVRLDRLEMCFDGVEGQAFRQLRDWMIRLTSSPVESR